MIPASPLTQPMVYVEAQNLPAHIGIIMDGNGRWAQLRGRERVDGHREGSKAVRRVVRAARRLGIRALTLFGSSCSRSATRSSTTASA
jgi:undecaprenyl diphosphate synthase